ncbi:MAG: HAMP domain-containing methyl-accepting chemotaxis protein [Deltaproteobacteria bacterium]|nr:HAMP domain-containing methyl-accepting chemotaxis protein [Deltaproteobacteria bacterium]
MHAGIMLPVAPGVQAAAAGPSTKRSFPGRISGLTVQPECQGVPNVFNRLSAGLLLKSVIAAMAGVVMLMLALNAWGSWRKLEAAGRIATIAEVSNQAFQVMHNLRLDRSRTVRGLNAPDAIEGEAKTLQAQTRNGGAAALQAVNQTLPRTDFADRDASVAKLAQLSKSLTALFAESAAALERPKAERRAGLAEQFDKEATVMLEFLEQLSARLVAAVKLQDATVDQMMQIKQLAWAARQSGGDASVAVSSVLSGQKKAAPDQPVKFHAALAQARGAWASLEDVAAGTTLPKALAEAIAAAKTKFLAPEHWAEREQVLQRLMAGQPPGITMAQWSASSGDRFGSVQAVAERALDAAKEHAEAQRDGAWRQLAIQIALLVGAAGLAFASMLAVSRRVIGPLHTIRDAMLKVAGGDLSVEAPFAERKDEVGALAGALATFKQNAVEKTRIEAEERERQAQARARQTAVEGHIQAFEGQVQAALQALGGAAQQMRNTADGMTEAVAQSTQQIEAASAASEDASSNVQTVAAASEELSASIAEISRQVSSAAGIAVRAVEETQQTDSTVQGLAEAAGRIGDVVKLISDIAGQTNLLALNATIEAARAGEAGKGFAVVASEVKSLANQTAKATEEISAQIGAIQSVTQDAVEAIKRIGVTIGEVSQIATSIASAVEEQGAATQEITRNTQHAAQRTREVSDNVVGVTSGTQATGGAAQNVKAAAETLGQHAGQLDREVQDFLGKIRAA